MRWALVGGALILAVASPAGAQPLPDRVVRSLSPNDVIIVTTKDSGETRGAFVALSSTSLVVSVKGQQREIRVENVISIEKPGDPVWGGAIIGGAILGLGFMGGAGASCSPDCDKEVPSAAAVGVAVGAAIGAGLDYLHRGRTRVYKAPASARAFRPAPADGPAATTTPPAAGTPHAAASLGTLWEQVKPGTPVSIALKDGRLLDGRFVRASETVLAVGTNDGVQEFAAEDVRRVVRKKGGNHGTRGLLIGMPLGALLGSGPCYRVDPLMQPAASGISCGTAVLLGTGAGGAIGLTIGRTVWRRTVVYQAPDVTALHGGDSPRLIDAKRVDILIAPILSRQRIGVAGTITFAGGARPRPGLARE